jgi:S-DNA-T family DNA segregation ATPase FtsK/SpoIIIE
MLDETVLQLAREYEGSAAPPIQLLPEYVRIDDFLIEAAFSAASQPPSTIRVRVGIEDISLRSILLELSTDTPHALVAGGPGSGRTGVLQTIMLVLAGTPGYEACQVVLVDFRRTSRPLRRLPCMRAYADTEERLVKAVEYLKAELSERVKRLREALERDDDDFTGQNMPPILLIIDDFDQLQALTRNPLNDLKEFWLQARELGLHILIAGSSGDLGRSDPLLTQVRAGRLGVVLGSDPSESPILGVRMSDMPPGSGYLVRRNTRYLAQFAHVPPEALSMWVNRFVQLAQTRVATMTPRHHCPWCPAESAGSSVDEIPAPAGDEAVMRDEMGAIVQGAASEGSQRRENMPVAGQAGKATDTEIDDPTPGEVRAIAGIHDF